MANNKLDKAAKALEAKKQLLGTEIQHLIDEESFFGEGGHPGPARRKNLPPKVLPSNSNIRRQ